MDKDTMNDKDTPLTSLVKSRVMDFMIKRNLSIYSLADKSGVTEIAIRDWYKKNHVPSILSLEKIAAVLDVEPFEFFCRDEDVMPLSPENKEILKLLDNLTQKQKEAVLLHIKSYFE